MLPWPWDDGTIKEIYAKDCFEHLFPLGIQVGQRNIFGVMTEAWRVLAPGGLLHVQVPSTEGPGAWQDPTHVTFWNSNTFLYFDPSQAHYQQYKVPAQFQIVTLTHKQGPDGVVWVDAKLVAMK